MTSRAASEVIELTARAWIPAAVIG